MLTTASAAIVGTSGGPMNSVKVKSLDCINFARACARTCSTYCSHINV